MIDISSLDTGDVLAIEGTGLYAWFIRWRTKSKFTHVAMILRQPDGLMVVQSIPGVGVALMLLERYLTATTGAIWVCFLDRIAAEQADKNYRHDLIQFVQGKYGNTYDWGGVLHYIFPWIKQRQGEEYCSELVAEAFNAIGLQMENGLTPEQIVEQPVLYRRTLIKER